MTHLQTCEVPGDKKTDTRQCTYRECMTDLAGLGEVGADGGDEVAVDAAAVARK
jgi:hypothetical protein